MGNIRCSAEQLYREDPEARVSFNMNYQPSIDDNSFSDNEDTQTFRVDPQRLYDKDEVSTFGGDRNETSLDEMLLAGRAGAALKEERAQDQAAP